jgi:hypothetical protein
MILPCIPVTRQQLIQQTENSEQCCCHETVLYLVENVSLSSSNCGKSYFYSLSSEMFPVMMSSAKENSHKPSL